MTLRIHVNAKGDVYKCTALDCLQLPGSRDNKNALSELVRNNLALLKLAEIGDVVDDIGVKLSKNVFIICELPPGHNEGIEDILIYVKATY